MKRLQRGVHTHQVALKKGLVKHSTLKVNLVRTHLSQSRESTLEVYLIS
jgi:hypothetical protein